MSKEAGSKIIKAIQEATGASEEDVKAMLYINNGDANAATAALIESPFQSVATTKQKKEKPVPTRDAYRDRGAAGRGSRGGGAVGGRGDRGYSGSGSGGGAFGGRGGGRDSRGSGPPSRSSYSHGSASNEAANHGTFSRNSARNAAAPNGSGWDASQPEASTSWGPSVAATPPPVVTAAGVWGAGGGATGASKKTLAEILKEENAAPPPLPPKPMAPPSSSHANFTQDEVLQTRTSGGVDWDAPAAFPSDDAPDGNDEQVLAPSSPGVYGAYGAPERSAPPTTGSEVDTLQLGFSSFGLGNQGLSDFSVSFGTGFTADGSTSSAQDPVQQPASVAPPPAAKAPEPPLKPTNYGTYILNANGDMVPATAAATPPAPQPTSQTAPSPLPPPTLRAVQQPMAPAPQTATSAPFVQQTQSPKPPSNAHGLTDFSNLSNQDTSTAAPAFSNFSSSGFGAAQPGQQQVSHTNNAPHVAKQPSSFGTSDSSATTSLAPSSSAPSSHLPPVPSASFAPMAAAYGSVQAGMSPMQYGSYGAMPGYAPQYNAAMNPAMYHMYTYPQYQTAAVVFPAQPVPSYPVAYGGAATSYSSGAAGGRGGNYSGYQPTGPGGAAGTANPTAYGVASAGAYGHMGAGDSVSSYAGYQSTESTSTGGRAVTANPTAYGVASTGAYGLMGAGGCVSNYAGYQSTESTSAGGRACTANPTAYGVASNGAYGLMGGVAGSYEGASSTAPAGNFMAKNQDENAVYNAMGTQQGGGHNRGGYGSGGYASGGVRGMPQSQYGNPNPTQGYGHMPQKGHYNSSGGSYGGANCQQQYGNPPV
eukprot:gene8475-4836_t